ncbi:YifB family Mg chelatase-like AAA ATPase [Nocardioides antri]|uniref:YifB family Mg chelatase-like AAA ATPase n=1 Tax=Nocardioides antri TaxID=2607659 RepID=A0A5B1M0K8_9ACTN|nr:YifB family Mg chelatase-like AAA ATPase [Nocardioides antri]KAA1426271.1 YifB family Mg chelatase-like AAA ATPase [Nocardioides antri]
MPFATTHTVALNGALGHLIDVQADVSPGQVSVTMVGRGDAALREGQDRIRMAIINSDLRWPATKRITLLLSPADLPKSGTHFDLALAVAVVSADGGLPDGALRNAAFIGELTLSGGLRPAVGVLPMVLAAAERGIDRVYVPEPQQDEARMVPGVDVFGVRSLAQVVALLRHEELPSAPPVAASSGTPLLSWRGEERLDELDLADLHGLTDAKYALEVAAAGGHPLLLSGPKGSGKTSIAERLPTILPDLTPEESLELTAIHSLAGVLDPADGMIVRPPFAAPHHDASKASIVGGGNGQVRPGEISRAHCGVLFMDEFPLFRSDVIDALRQPLESGDITIARRDESVRLPARGLLVLAANPCPCGNYSSVPRANQCTCADPVRRAYQAKVSGPIADRIDITRHVRPALGGQVDRFRPPESSSVVRERVAAARQRQRERFAGCSWRLNSQVPSPRLKDAWPITGDGGRMIDEATYRGRLGARGAVRVARLAWTVADLESVRSGRDIRPGPAHVDTALRLRAGEPLDLRVAEERAG